MSESIRGYLRFYLSETLLSSYRVRNLLKEGAADRPAF